MLGVNGTHFIAKGCVLNTGEVLDPLLPPVLAADNAASWRHLFSGWPAGVPYRGVVVTSFDEQIPFEAFQFTESMLLLDRPTPDTLGARRIIVPFTNIAAVKITEVTQEKAFEPVGFAAPTATSKPKADRPRRPFVP